MNGCHDDHDYEEIECYYCKKQSEEMETENCVHGDDEAQDGYAGLRPLQHKVCSGSEIRKQTRGLGK